MHLHWVRNVRQVLCVLTAVGVSACGGGGGNSSGPVATSGPSSSSSSASSGSSASSSASSSSSAATQPTISGLTYTPTLVQASRTAFTVNGSVSFADSGGDVTSLTLTVLDPAGAQLSTSTTPVQGLAGQLSGTIVAGVQVTGAGAGFYTIRVSVTDAAGSRSNELSGTFQIVAVASQATLIATTGSSPRSLTLAGSNLYWSQAGEDVVKSAPLAGGSSVTLATKIIYPAGVAFAGTDAIWIEDRAHLPGLCGPATQGRMLRRTTAAGVTSVLATSPGCAGGSYDIVIINNTAYWVSSTGTPNTYFINATSLADGTTTSIYSVPFVPIVALAARGGVLYWMENQFPVSMSAIRSMVGGGGPVSTIASGFDSAVNAFAVDSAAVYYTTPNYPRSIPPTTEALKAQSLSGGAPVTLAGAVATPTSLVATGSAVAWLNTSGVYEVPAAGGSSSQWGSVTGIPLDLLYDGLNYYWSEYSAVGTTTSTQSRVSSVARVGGSTTVRYQGTDLPSGLVTDASGQINWVEHGLYAANIPDGSGRIARLVAGGAVQTVVSGMASDSPTLTASSTSLCAVDLQRVKCMPVGGGMFVTRGAEDSTATISAVAADAGYVYWGTESLPSSIRRTGVSGGGTMTLVDSSAVGASGGSVGSLRPTPTGNLCWNWVTSQNLLVCAPSSGPSNSVTTIASGLSAIGGLAVDASRAYVALTGAGSVVSYSLSGGSQTTVTNTPSSGGGIQLALDGNTLFWLSVGAGGRIYGVPASGGTSTEVLEFDGSTAANAFAVDASNVYFLNPVQQEIRRSPR